MMIIHLKCFLKKIYTYHLIMNKKLDILSKIIIPLSMWVIKLDLSLKIVWVLPFVNKTNYSIF